MSFKEFMEHLRNHDVTKESHSQCPFAHRQPPPQKPPPPVEPKKTLGTDYAKALQDEDDESDRQLALIKLNLDYRNIENTSSMAESAYRAKHESERLTYIYENYSFQRTSDNDLHINEYKQLIIENVACHPVNIIKGHTGCGKTTQVPQFILDDCRNNNIHCNIVVTQPRRIAAISVAKRVCEERNWKLGSLVGYQVGLDKVASEDTRLLYCTTGILLQKLVATQDTSMYTHIIVDEVHERDCETDFLLIVLKRLMRIKGIDSKIILMSATMNTDKFSEYFAQNKFMVKRGAPVIELTKETRFPVSTFYLDSLESRLPIKLPPGAFEIPQICPAMYDFAACLLAIFNAIDIQEDYTKKQVLGSVLIFLPGIIEIEKMFTILRNKNSENPSEEWILCPLHSSITHDEQSKVFQQPPKGARKIILSTNIAESSITVPDIKYVIDFCLTKIQVQEPDMLYTTLQMSWISKSHGKQREGRVGRVMPGRVYKLVPEHLYKALPEELTPEILRCALETLILKSKQLNMGSPTSILGRALDPPDLSNIQRTIFDLKALGALLVTSNGSYKEDDGDITLIGHIMAALPMDPHLSKLVLLGHMFGCLEESIIMACAMSVRHFFSNPFKKQLDAYSAKLAWSDGLCSDPLAFLNCYSLWKHKFRSGAYPNKGLSSESEWARQHYVQVKSLHEVFRLETEVRLRLRKFNISVNERMVEDWRTNEKKASLLKIILAGASYPHYFSLKPVDAKEANRTLNSNNPWNTVYVTNFPTDQPGPLYTQSIKQYFKQCGSGVSLSFDSSSKVWVSFESSITSYDTSATMHENNKVMKAVYRAIKMRQLGLPMPIPILPSLQANKRATKIFGNNAILNHSWPRKVLPTSRPRMPAFDVDFFPVLITHIDSPHSFWAIFTSEDMKKRQTWLTNKMQNKDLFVPLSPRAIQRGVEGKICVAPYTEDGHVYYYRAKIICIFRSGQLAKVHFIDYGNSTDIEVHKLFDFNENAHKHGLSNEPALAVHCSLAEIEPSVKLNPNGFWSKQSTLAFLNRFEDDKAIAWVYSIVNDVVNVYLFDENKTIGKPDWKTLPTNSFNYHLISEGYAQHAEETYLSRNNHIARQSPNFKNRSHEHPDDVGFSADLPFESPTFRECKEKVNLKGPFSPLESIIFCLTKKSSNVSIDFNSVNSVLLDTYMIDSKRLILASYVTRNDNSGKFTLHNTTLMPAVLGLHSLIPMIFAPRVELRVNKWRSTYIGALCGLGYDEETKLGYHRENDMEIEFDAEIDQTDIDDVSKIRFWMNYMISTDPGADKTPSSARYSHAQEKIQELTLKLITRTRSRQNFDIFDDRYEWGKIENEHLLKPCVDGMGKPVFFPLDSVKLEKESLSLYDAMREHLEELRLYAEGIYKLRDEITCNLCQHLSPDAHDLDLHLKSSMHRYNFSNFITS